MAGYGCLGPSPAKRAAMQRERTNMMLPIPLDDREAKVLMELAQMQGVSRERIMLQGLRLYQMACMAAHEGYTEVRFQNTKGELKPRLGGGCGGDDDDEGPVRPA